MQVLAPAGEHDGQPLREEEQACRAILQDLAARGRLRDPERQGPALLERFTRVLHQVRLRAPEEA